MRRDLDRAKKEASEREALQQTLIKLLEEAEKISQNYALDTADMLLALSNLFEHTLVEDVSFTERTTQPPQGSSVFIFGNDSGHFKVWYEILPKSKTVAISYLQINSVP